MLHLYSVGFLVGIIVSVILAVAGGIAIYLLFMAKSNEGKFTGFWGWVYEFVHFRKLMVETLLKVLYLIAALMVTLLSFVYLFTGQVVSFLLWLVVGNIAARLGFEFMLMAVLVCRNTSEINRKMKE